MLVIRTSKKKTIVCDFCHQKKGYILPKGDFKSLNNWIMHVNIAQIPNIHYFCSKECRNQWCYKVHKKGVIPKEQNNFHEILELFLERYNFKKTLKK